MSIQPVFINPKEISFSTYSSNLKTDYDAGSSTITIYSIAQFDVNQILLIGEYGSEGSEIIKTHGSTAPTGNTVTLASNTTRPHSKDEPVSIISFDQVEFSHADTLTGSKTIIGSLVDIDPEQDLMKIDDTTHSSGYYFTRYYNTILDIYSDYSDGIPYNGMPKNTVGYAIDNAMNELGARFTENLTFGMLIEFAKEMLMLVRGKKKAWSKTQEYDYVVGTLSAGVRKYTMPSTIYDPNSNKSILNLRVGGKTPITYIDRSEYIQATDGVVYTEVATQATAGQTSLVLDDTSDLDDSGSVDVFVSGTKHSIVYTANSKSTNTLTVGSDQITTTIPVDSPVWKNVDESGVLYYSVWDGEIYLWPMISSEDDGKNLLMDFNTDIEDIDSQMDIIKGTKYDMLKQYLKFKIRTITENNGKEDLKDPSHLLFRELLKDAQINDESAENNSFRPRSTSFFGGRSHNSRR